MDMIAKEILLDGDEQAILQAKKEIEVLLGSSSKQMEEAAPSDDCCRFCYDELTDPYILACGHKLCKPCMHSYVAGKIDEMLLPICCEECKAPMSHMDLQTICDEKQMTKLYHISFNKFLSEHSTMYHPCLTPNCGQIYSLLDQKRIFECDTCGKKYCKSCESEEHVNMSCTEFKNPAKYQQELEMLRQFKLQNNIKTCNKCKADIIKNEGCDHISCPCGNHICWRCMASFATGEQTYSHMATCNKK